MLMAESFDINKHHLEPYETKPMKQPKRHPKLKGQRLGQVVYNALANAMSNVTHDRLNEHVGANLFHISDEYLVKLINDYLKEQ